MTDLSRLVDAPGANSLPYVDPAFPERPLVLHAARPRQFAADTPVLFVHHGVGRNGAAYRDYWLPLVEEADILAIAIEFPEASFPEYLRYHFGNLHNEDGTPNPREQWTYGIDERLFAALQAQGVTTRAALRCVRPFRRRPVRASHAVVRVSRPCCRRGQRQCRHLCDAGPRHRLAVRPRRDRARRGCAAGAAALSASP